MFKNPKKSLIFKYLIFGAKIQICLLRWLCWQSFKKWDILAICTHCEWCSSPHVIKASLTRKVLNAVLKLLRMSKGISDAEEAEELHLSQVSNCNIPQAKQHWHHLIDSFKSYKRQSPAVAEIHYDSISPRWNCWEEQQQLELGLWLRRPKRPFYHWPFNEPFVPLFCPWSF